MNEGQKNKILNPPRLISGVLVLTVSNIIVKFLGLLCKIPLHNLLGDSGMAYFNIAYNIFTTLYMVSTAGLPIAISILISGSHTSGREKEVKKIFNIALLIFFIMGIFGCGVMFFGAEPLAVLMGSRQSYTAIMTIAPTLFFICISSAVRGYFQGHQNMVPTAVSEIIEAIGKFAIGVALGYYAIKNGYSIEISAAYAIAGIAIGVACGTLYLCVAKTLRRSDDSVYAETRVADCMSGKGIFNEIIKIAVPITISAVALNLTGLVDTFTIINCLKRFVGAAAAESAYGNYSTLAVTLFHLPSAFIYPIASSLTPALAGANASGDRIRATASLKAAMKLTAVISVPSAFGMAVLSKPILGLLFINSSAESVNTAAPLLSILSAGLFFTGILTVTSSVLQSYKLVRYPLISMFSGAVVKLVLNIILINIEKLGIYGAPISTVISYLVMASVNLYFLLKYIKPEFNVFSLYIKPAIAALASSVITVLSFVGSCLIVSEAAATLISIFVTVIVYFLMLFILRAFSESDFNMLPAGKKISAFLKKIKLLR